MTKKIKIGLSVVQSGQFAGQIYTVGNCRKKVMLKDWAGNLWGANVADLAVWSKGVVYGLA